MKYCPAGCRIIEIMRHHACLFLLFPIMILSFYLIRFLSNNYPKNIQTITIRKLQKHKKRTRTVFFPFWFFLLTYHQPAVCVVSVVAVPSVAAPSVVVPSAVVSVAVVSFRVPGSTISPSVEAVPVSESASSWVTTCP